VAKSKSTKIRGRQKLWLQSLAAQKLGVRRHIGLAAIVALAAQQIGTAADGKGHYDVLIAFVGEAPTARPSELPPKRTRKPRPATTGQVDPVSDEFLLTYAWRQLRMRVLVKHGAKCQCCGCDASDGVKIHVDHIKPRRKYPELALDESNLQVLCEVCNHGKGNWDETDWRRQNEQFAPMWSKSTH
jgi:5-methylcytosine-specific restriction endonuclease McrA